MINVINWIFTTILTNKRPIKKGYKYSSKRLRD